MSRVSPRIRRLLLAALIIVAVGAVGFFGFVAHDLHRSFPNVAAQFAHDDNAAKIARGHYIATAADCAACHTVEGAPELAGGYEIKTPFGIIRSSNITPDRETGIGTWTEAQFDRALRHGQSRGTYLYPAMPYTAYTKLSDRDVDDIWAYLKTVKPVHSAVAENLMPFPFNQRWLMAGWNMLFFRDGPYVADPRQDAATNRGAYLAEAAAHCGTCHTPKNFLGADGSHPLEGSAVTGMYANDLTPNPTVGLGSWTDRDIVRYLKTGANRHSVASAEMGLAVEKSFQYLTDADVQAIASYLRSLPASATTAPAATPASDPAMQTGRRIYDSQCEACHTSSGQGVRDMIPTLAASASVNAPDAISLETIVLKGGDGPASHANPTGAGMPRFDWKLSDEQIAAVLTYIRNSWSNAAAPVKLGDVAKLRKSTKAGAAIRIPDAPASR